MNKKLNQVCVILTTRDQVLMVGLMSALGVSFVNAFLSERNFFIYVDIEIRHFKDVLETIGIYLYGMRFSIMDHD